MILVGKINRLIMQEPKHRGKIVTYKPDRGFGFIESDVFNNSIYFHFSQIIGQERSALYAELNTRSDLFNIEVTFEVFEDKWGRGLQAKQINLISEFSDLEEFLRSSESTRDNARSVFFNLASMKGIVHISKDQDLYRLTVSRIIKDAGRWENLVAIANQWLEALSLLKTQSTVYIQGSKEIEKLANSIMDIIQLKPTNKNYAFTQIPAYILPISSPKIPLKIFRESNDFFFMIVLNESILNRFINDIPFDKEVNFIVCLENVPLITNKEILNGHKNNILIKEKTVIELFAGDDSEYPRILGHNFRSNLPKRKLQPYEAGAAYHDSIFSGRVNERLRILEDRNSNYALYGGRKIGKTWFLKDICKWATDAPFSSYYFAVYVSLQGVENLAEAAELIIEAVDHNLSQKSKSVTNPLSQLRSTLLNAHKVTKKTVLIALDEVDDILKIQNCYDLFSKLRQLQHTYPDSFKFVFAGFKELMHAFRDIKTNNPFANWVGTNHFALGGLNEEDLYSLIIRPFLWLGFEFKEARILSTVYELTSGHPYYTQLLCHNVLNARLSSHSYTLTWQHFEKFAAIDFFHEVFDIFTLNLSPLQLLIGKVFADSDIAFNEDDIARELKERFDLDFSNRRIWEEMKILCACSVFKLSVEGYLPVMQRINYEFFKEQDDEELAIKYLETLEENHGI